MTLNRKKTSDNKDWNTPPKYIPIIKELLGAVCIDPCSNEYSFVDAAVRYYKKDDGLKKPWGAATVYVNPPYGRDPEMKTSISDWVKKALEAHLNGSEVLMLIPVATSSRHFKDIVFKHACGICFIGDYRLRFWLNGQEHKKGSPMACCFVYFGERYDDFERLFSTQGKCLRINDASS